MASCWHISTGGAQSSLLQTWQCSKAFTQRCRRIIISHPTTRFPQTNYCCLLAILSLFRWKIFGRASFPFYQFRNLQLRSHAIYTKANHARLFGNSLARRRFQLDSFFSRTSILWNRLQRGYLAEQCNRNLFIFMTNHYLSYLSS